MTFFHKPRCSASLECSGIGGRPTNFDTRCKVTIATFPTKKHNLDVLLATPFLRATFHVGSLANERQVSAHVCVPKEMKKTGEETPFNAYGGEHDTLFPAQVSNCEASVLKARTRSFASGHSIADAKKNLLVHERAFLKVGAPGGLSNLFLLSLSLSPNAPFKSARIVAGKGFRNNRRWLVHSPEPRLSRAGTHAMTPWRFQDSFLLKAGVRAFG